MTLAALAGEERRRMIDWLATVAGVTTAEQVTSVSRRNAAGVDHCGRRN